MILDYQYSKTLKKFSISYVTPQGGKKVLNYNVSRFKTWYEDPKGKYQNWNGKPCSPRMTSDPGPYDLRTFMRELPEETRKLLEGRYNPKLYAFDIEVEVDEMEFPEPSQAKYPIQTISVVNDSLDVVVMGLKPLDDPEDKMQKLYDEYLAGSSFYKSLGLKRKPVIRYVKFDSERSMLEYFLENIVAKSPVIAGWNSLLFDWQYIQNRVKYYYPDIRFSKCSISGLTYGKMCQDMKGDKVRLTLPVHTLVLDMMDIIGAFDLAVMPIKESLSLDYIASSTVGLHKIQYKGDLQKLYNEDYPTYVFYNAVDSVLVQLIDKKFKTLSILEAQALYMEDKISFATSKIAIAEAIFFQHWYNEGIKIVQPEPFRGERGELQGAYVREPIPGKHLWVACIDAASLYPSTIITCNLSFENYLGKEGVEFTHEQVEAFKKDPNYFVSLLGNVYKNDKDYAFKKIQSRLKANRSTGKYLAKQLDAMVITDIDHIRKGVKVKSIEYPQNIVDDIATLGYVVQGTDDLRSIDNLDEFESKLKDQIIYYQSYEQAIKLIMNSLYGGSSHVMFDFFNIQVANDITAEGRNLIKMMGEYIQKNLQDNWFSMTDLHKKLGITVKRDA